MAPRADTCTLTSQTRAASRSVWQTHPSERGPHATKMTSRRERRLRPRAFTVDCLAALSKPATFDVCFRSPCRPPSRPHTMLFGGLPAKGRGYWGAGHVNEVGWGSASM